MLLWEIIRLTFDEVFYGEESYLRKGIDGELEMSFEFRVVKGRKLQGSLLSPSHAGLSGVFAYEGS